MSNNMSDMLRPRVGGKFLYVGEEKFYVRGATYGTFRPDDDGTDYSQEKVEIDFPMLRQHGFNAIRTYTVPPVWFLDKASEHGLYVMVGLPWEQHVAFLDDPRRRASIKRRVREAASQCKGHPALLCYTVGNEIPAPIVRWHGATEVESFIRELYDVVKAEDPDALVTYVNYPSTEYLKLPFLDLFTFNVYLENQNSLSKYIARLQNLAGDVPVLMAEIGLDSQRNGEARQAETLSWQVTTAFEGGCAGAFIFSWTDEWFRGGHEIEDWDFGLVTRDRKEKPALAAVSRSFDNSPFRQTLHIPRSL